ncbi:MAG: hypothetical protein MRY83_08285, partial [Flavobacteriales bacterium]|nr:hypothetical protein [Flavobacteriales bacterium]
KIAYYLPELEKRLDWCKKNINSNNDSIKNILESKLKLLKNEFKKEDLSNSDINFNHHSGLSYEEFDQSIAGHAKIFLEFTNTYYQLKFDTVSQLKEQMIYAQKDAELESSLDFLRNKFSNNYVTDIVKGIFYRHQIIEKDGNLVRIVDPIFNLDNRKKILGIGSHFYAPFKYIFRNIKFETLHFNLIIIWLMNIILFVTLYFNFFYKMLGLWQKLGKKIIR